MVLYIIIKYFIIKHVKSITFHAVSSPPISVGPTIISSESLIDLLTSSSSSSS